KYESDKDRAFKTLCEFGGLDIAGLVGVFIGGARYRVPIVVDGLVTAAAALCAERIAPGVREYMIASHSGREKGIDAVLNVLRLRPLISGNMALGEGTGAVMLFPLLDLALGFLETGSTFAEIDVAEYERFGKCSF
ncbi:MAG: nicotinate-nucleotide--dimethylbenzimidazole phosphoribosyltransferase, partial [Thermoguttaceae bacterium]|nr:nicotinate-nucleotide--dimethylbenzimidazole phosphoribosyltransferase [Thermoguttaceae bacterium]